MPPLQIAVAALSFCQNALLRTAVQTRFGTVRFHEDRTRLAGPALAAFLADADAAIIGTEPVDAAVLAQCPQLRFIAKYGVGLDNLDIEACARHGVDIGWTGGVNRRAVAEQTVCLMIGLCRNLFYTARALQDGRWVKNGGRMLSGRTVGIIGLGHIGKEVARLLRSFDCRILANDCLDVTAYCQAEGLTAVDKPALYAEAEIITLHVPLTPATRNLINATTLAAVRPGAMLVNTARGGVVDEAALITALHSGHLAGAALDVFAQEPAIDPALRQAPNLICTPHVAGNAVEAVLAMGQSAIDHLGRFVSAQ